MTTTSDYTLADMRKPVWSGRMDSLPSHHGEVSPYASVEPRICDPYLLEKDSGLDTESERDRRVLSRSEVHALLQKLRSDIHTLRDSVSSRVDDDDAMYQKIENKYRIKEKRRTAGDYLRRQAQDRGLHRLGCLFNQNIPLVCRLIWVLIVGALLALAAYQLRDRILKFINFRTYSSVQIYQLDAMPFPAVTICNLNPYRLSKAVETGQYDSLQKITQGALPSTSIPLTNPLGNQTYTNFLKNVSHQREDFILRCQWKDRGCGPANFTLSFTDTGLCYTFQPDPNTIKVDRPGPSSGLSLLLNVEQYEYLPGNKRGVGAKVTIHEPGHLTEVNQQGINVPVGKHTAMEIKQIKHMRLQPPLGKCRSITSFDGNSAELQYTRDLCERRCKTREVIAACDCKPPSSPDPHKDIGECDVRKYFTCVVKVNGLNGRNPKECGCEAECDRIEFDIFASHATLASYGEVNWRREFKNLAELEERVRNARDTFQKEDLSIRNHDREQLISLKESLKNSFIQADSFLTYVKQYDQEHTNASNNLVEAVKELNKSVLATYNFFRSTGHTAFDIFVQKLREALDRISAKSREVYPGKSCRPEMTFSRNVDAMMTNLSRLVQTEKQDWSQNLPVVAEIQNGIRTFQDELLSGYGQNYREFKQSRRFYDIKTRGLLDTTQKLSGFLLKSYWLLGNATYACRRHNIATANTKYNDFLSTIKEAERSQGKLTEELGELNRKYIESRHGVISLYQTLTSIGANTTTDSASLRKDVKQMKSFAEILKTKVSYLQASMESVVAGYLNNDFNKTAMGNRLKDDKIFKEMNEVESIVRGILSMTNSMQASGWNLVNPIKPISARLSEFGLMETKKVQHIFDRLTFSLLSKEVKHLNDEIQTSLSIIRSYQEELSDYTRSNRINEDFYKANLLQLELYFPDLTETRITQRIAYGLFDLACDIGGTFALYLGFSLLTAFDIIDFLGAFCKWCAYPSRQ